MKAYTYIVTNKINGMWYYGVRFAKGCKKTDLLKKYFTSSKVVHKAIEKYGIENFNYQIRREFNVIDDALEWEIKVLRRMKVRYRKDCYNISHGIKSRVFSENEKQIVTDEFRKKMSEIRKGIPCSDRQRQRNKASGTKRGLLIWIKKWKNKDPCRNYKINQLTNYLNYIDMYRPKLVFIKTEIIRHLEFILDPLTKKTCGPQLAEKGKKIQESLKDKVFYTSPDGATAIRLHKDILPPEGWIRGLKLSERTEKIRKTSSGRIHSQKTKDVMSIFGKNKKYYTSPDFTEVRAFQNDEDAPKEWIKGNKLKSRNDKITKYLKEVRYADR